jgi:hypothetical protein
MVTTVLWIAELRFTTGHADQNKAPTQDEGSTGTGDG